MKEINIGDEIVPYGLVTKVTDTRVHFGDKYYARKTVEDKMNGIIYKESPDTEVDWTNPEEVDKYYSTFKWWKGVLRMQHSGTRQILEVKNNKVFFNSEFYLPFYHSPNNTIRTTEKLYLKDSYVWGYCVKLGNAFYEHMTKHKVNVFWVERVISKEEHQYGIEKAENYKKFMNPEIAYGALDYLKTLNLNRINGKDLNLLKKEVFKMFDHSIFPYTTQKVTFTIGSFINDPIIEVQHRNRHGCLNIDNSYHGSQPFANDYGTILQCEPYFTNEHGTYTRVEHNEITWDKVMLDLLASRIVIAWDRAIENNYRMYGG